MRMTQAERLILKNQKLIMMTLSALLHAPGVASGHLHVELTRHISRTLRAIEEAKTWQE